MTVTAETAEKKTTTFDEQKMRGMKARVQQNSQVINRLVDSIIGKYAAPLDDYFTKVKELIEFHDTLSNEDIERIVLQLPVYMYFAAEALETLGVEGDNAKAVKSEAFNTVYLEMEGTIQDKTKAAELQTFSEEMLETAYVRAYKKLKIQVEKSEHLFTGAKKVMDKRIRELDLHHMDRLNNGRRN